MSNAAKARQIMLDTFHSGNISGMSTAEIVQIRDELANLWIQIDGTEITPNMTEQEVMDTLSAPWDTLGEIWLYPSTFDNYYYQIEFESGVVKATDFVKSKFS